MINEIYDFDALETEEQQKEYKITNDAAAEWAIKKIKYEDANNERLIACIDAEIEQLKAKKEEIKNRNNTAFLKGKLCEYFESVKDNAKETKTQLKYELPSGSLIFKKPSVSYERDNDKIISWLTENNKFEYIKTNPSVDWAELKKVDFLSDIDGITEIHTEAKFEVK